MRVGTDSRAWSSQLSSGPHLHFPSQKYLLHTDSQYLLGFYDSTAPSFPGCLTPTLPWIRPSLLRTYSLLLSLWLEPSSSHFFLSPGFSIPCRILCFRHNPSQRLSHFPS